jgi:lysophospholipase L1-like esterase
MFAVIVGVVVGYRLGQPSPPAPRQAAFDCAALTRLTDSTAAERTVLAANESGPTAVFLGDSYTQGVGLTDIRDDYAYVTAHALRWRPVLNAAGGTGYVNGGPCRGEQFSARVPQVVAARPATVVIQGGLDDYKVPPAEITDAATRLYAQLHKALPRTRLLVVGPHRVPKVSNVQPAAEALRTATSRAHVAYIDTSSWPLSFEKDGIHLSVAGHKTYGLRLAAAIHRATGR